MSHAPRHAPSHATTRGASDVLHDERRWASRSTTGVAALVDQLERKVVDRDRPGGSGWLPVAFEAPPASRTAESSAEPPD